MSCPICRKRKAERFCPAKAEQICAVCCGTEREVTLDCPPDCGYLVSAHRYEDRQTRNLPQDTPLLDVKLSSRVIQAHPQLISAIAFTVAKFCSTQPAATDPDVLSSLQALAESYKTLAAGIVYENAPTQPVRRDLYQAIAAFLNETKQQANATPSGRLADGDIFQLLVFLFRMGLLRSNQRPRSHKFIEFLRGQFPGAQELKREESRIILP